MEVFRGRPASASHEAVAPEPLNCRPLTRQPPRPPRAPRGATHRCTQRVNDVVVVPTAWWHATCNTGDTFAFGGEDDCDKAACSVREPPSNGTRPARVCPDTSSAAACFGAYGATSAEEERERIPPLRIEQALLSVGRVDPELWTALGIPAREAEVGKDEL